MSKIFVLMLNILFLSSCVVNLDKDGVTEFSALQVSQLDYTAKDVAIYEASERTKSVSVKFEKSSYDLILIKISKSKINGEIKQEFSLTSADEDFQDVLNFMEADFTYSLKFQPGPAPICALPTSSESLKNAEGEIIKVPDEFLNIFHDKYKNIQGYTVSFLSNTNSPSGRPMDDHIVKKYLELARQL